MNRRQAIALSLMALARGVRVDAQQPEGQWWRVKEGDGAQWFQFMFDGCAGFRFIKKDRKTGKDETIELPMEELWKALKGE
jgi:hypothetical protein